MSNFLYSLLRKQKKMRRSAMSVKTMRVTAMWMRGGVKIEGSSKVGCSLAKLEPLE
jgi:hypothetical protein